jgi:DNA-binding PadR family transcriptional regulator
LIRSPVYGALLGLLVERDAHGYELLKRFEREYGELLPLSGPSHIYTALDVLEAQGLIEAVPMAHASAREATRQPRPRYRSTQAGERAFTEWVMARQCEDRRQWRLFVRHLSVLARKPEVGLKVIEFCEEAYLKEARQASPERPVTARSEPSGLASRLVDEETRLTVTGRLSWVEYARREFRALPPSSRQVGSWRRGR